MPAEAGIQWCRTWMWSSCKDLDSGIRRNDGQEWAGEVVMPADPGSGVRGRRRHPVMGPA